MRTVHGPTRTITLEQLASLLDSYAVDLKDGIPPDLVANRLGNLGDGVRNNRIVIR